MHAVILPPLFLPPATYFRAMDKADIAVIDTDLRYDKRYKAVHRTVMAGPHGPVLLTVPVSTPGTSHCNWNRVTISPHAEWYRTHRATLATLEGATPWFDTMRHDILPLIDSCAVGRSIVDLDIDLILALRRLANIDTPLTTTLDTRHLSTDDTITDMRRHNWYPDTCTTSALAQLFANGNID